MSTPHEPVPGLGKLLGQQISGTPADGVPFELGAMLDHVAPKGTAGETPESKQLMVRRMQQELFNAMLALQEGMGCHIFTVCQMASVFDAKAGKVLPCVDLVVFKEDAEGKRVAHPNRFMAMGHINALILAGRYVHGLLMLDHQTNCNHQPYFDQVREHDEAANWKSAIVIPGRN